MANFQSSNLLKALARINAKFTEQELRTKQSPALGLAIKNQDLLIPGHEELRTREDRPVEVHVLARTKRVPTNERTHNHTGNRGDSFKMDITWTTFADTFSMSLKQLDNNVFNFTEVLSNNIYNVALNLHEQVETFLIDYLMAARTTINAGNVGGTFNAVTDAFEINQANKQKFLAIVKSMMRKNNYRGMYDLIASSQLYLDQEFNNAQGTGNQTNLNYQFQGLNILESTELADADYAQGVALVMPEGTFGILPWIPKHNINGRGDYNSVLGGYGSIPDPLGSGIDFALHGYTERADTSAANGSKQDDLMQFEISFDLAPVLPPLSNVGESTVFEVGQLAA